MGFEGPAIESDEEDCIYLALHASWSMLGRRADAAAHEVGWAYFERGSTDDLRVALEECEGG